MFTRFKFCIITHGARLHDTHDRQYPLFWVHIHNPSILDIVIVEKIKNLSENLFCGKFVPPATSPLQLHFKLVTAVGCLAEGIPASRQTLLHRSQCCCMLLQ